MDKSQTKQNIDYFPLWKPHYRTEEKFWGTSKRSYRAIASASSSFIKNTYVRKAIFTKCNFECTHCGAKEDLVLDHIISIYEAFKNKELISILNTYQNLQILCRKCNSIKGPKRKVLDE